MNGASFVPVRRRASVPKSNGTNRRSRPRTRRRSPPRTRRGPLEGDFSLGRRRWLAPVGTQFRDRRRMGRLFVGQWFLRHGQALDALPGLFQFSLAELEILTPARDRSDRFLETEPAVFQRAQRRVELRQRLLVGDRFIDAHGTTWSTVASSRPADSRTLTGCPWRASTASRMMRPSWPSRQML